MKVIKLLLPAQVAITNQSLNMALGQFGINVNKFLEDFNIKSNSFDKGLLLLVELSYIDNNNYNFIIKSIFIPFIIKSYKIELKSKNKNMNKTDLYYIMNYYLKNFNINYDKKNLLKNIKGTYNSIH